MDKEVILIFSAVFVVGFAGLFTNLMSANTTEFAQYSVNSESLIIDNGDVYSYDAISGEFSCRKCKRAIKKVTKEIARVDDNIKKAVDKVEAEGKRFGKRTNAEWQRFDDRVGNELERFGSHVEDEFNRIDDNIKKLGDKAEEEYKRLIKKVREEIDTQKDVLKSLSKGNICQTYNAAQKSDLYDAKKWIYDQVLPVIKPVLRPHVAAIVSQVAAPINAIPIIGQVIYVTVVPIATEWGTDYAAKKVVREALEECN